MSASDKKRQRKENAATNMTQRQKEAKKEARSLKMYTWSFWIIVVLCVSLVAGMLLYNPVDGMIRNLTTAVQVGDQSLSAVELNYFYIDEINTYCQNYSSYLSYILDTTKAIGDQYYDETNKVTWADNFLDMTISSIKDTYALYNAAKAAGYELSADEKTELNTLKENLKIYAQYYGYSNTNDYLISIYGNGAEEKSYLAYYEVVKTANSYYNSYAEDLKESYTPTQIRDFEKGELYKYNSYSYISFLLSLDKFKIGGVKGENGTITYTDEQMAQFRENLKKAAEELAVADNNTLEKLNEAIKELEISLKPADSSSSSSSSTTTTTPTTAPTTAPSTDSTGETTAPSTDSTGETTAPSTDSTGDTTTPTTSTGSTTGTTTGTTTYSTATENKNMLYTKITTAIQEWIRDEARVSGDITMIANTSTEVKNGETIETVNGYYIVIYNGMDKNECNLVNVRHVLVNFKSATGASTYTDAEKATAKETAEKLYNDWKAAGDLSEDSFAELAKKNSDDGSAEQGGLFEDIVPGQMVTNFNDWCFDKERKAGDTGIVESEYGYHIMFFVGNSETIYRDYLIINDMQTKDLSAWKSGLIEKTVVELKNSNYIDRSMKLQSSSSY